MPIFAVALVHTRRHRRTRVTPVLVPVPLWRLVLEEAGLAIAGATEWLRRRVTGR